MHSPNILDIEVTEDASKCDKSIDSYEVQEKKKEAKFSILEVLKLLPKIIDFNELQFENILDILVTNEVSKLDNSADNNDEHPENVIHKLLSFGVFKLFKFIEVKLLHPRNIYIILVNSEVSKFDKSTSNKLVNV